MQCKICTMRLNIVKAVTKFTLPLVTRIQHRHDITGIESQNTYSRKVQVRHEINETLV